MKYDEFLGQVQSRAHLGTLGDAVGAIRSTMETLGERLAGGEAKDLASQLPREIGYYLFRGASLPGGERFSYDEFIQRVAERESVDPPAAAFHSRVVMELVSEAVSFGEMEDVIQQLPSDFAPLFAGSTGNVRKDGRGGGAAGDRSVNPEPAAPRSQRMHVEPS
jgi:uncharacterized protein (DUF2267 family)